MVSMNNIKIINNAFLKLLIMVSALPCLFFNTFALAGNQASTVEVIHSKIHKEPSTISKKGADRVIRGCGWSDDQEDCRVSYRDRIPQDCPVCSRRNDIGFRVLRER
jgi:hypothetical protein